MVDASEVNHCTCGFEWLGGFECPRCNMTAVKVSHKGKAGYLRLPEKLALYLLGPEDPSVQCGSCPKCTGNTI